MSASLGFPQSPGAIRENGFWVRSGQSTTDTFALAKFADRPVCSTEDTSKLPVEFSRY